jgi:hypothetical protein
MNELNTSKQKSAIFGNFYLQNTLQKIRHLLIFNLTTDMAIKTLQANLLSPSLTWLNHFQQIGINMLPVSAFQWHNRSQMCFATFV